MDKIPEFRSVVGALIVLRRQPSAKAMRIELERLVAGIPRLRQRVCEVPLGLGTPEWTDDEGFDLDHHLRRIAVPSPGRLDDLLAELGPLYEAPLDASRPLWEAHLAEGLDDGRGAVFVKMHHCLIDGAGGARLLDSLSGAERSAERPAGRAGRRSVSSAALLDRAFRHGVGEVVDLGGAIARGAGKAAWNPRWAAAAVLSGLRAGVGFAHELVPNRAENPLGASRSLARRLATFEMRLGEVDRVRERLGATVNDVVLVVVSGALHRWFQVEGIEVDDLRALVPIDLHEGRDAAAGSRMARVSLSLPVGESSTLRRLRIIQERMGAVKADRRATLHPWFARTVLAIPVPVAEMLVRQQNSRASLVCTSACGPRHGCSLAGQPIERIYPYVPLSGDHPLAIAVLAYRDVLCVGIDADAVAMSDIGRLRSDLQASYEDLLGAGSPRAASQARRRRPVRKKAAL